MATDAQVAKWYAYLSAHFPEDAVQHAFMRLYEGKYTDEGDDKLGHWLCTVARNYKLTALFKDKREPACANMPETPVAPTALARAQAREELLRCSLYSVLNAFYGPTETANLTGVKVGTVKSRTHRRKPTNG